MSTKYQLDLNSTYNFRFFGSSIIGAGITGGKLVAQMTYLTAKAIDDVAGLHQQLLPYLPAGTIVDPTKLVYYQIQTSPTNTMVVAEDWLMSAPELITTQSVSVSINRITNSKLQALRAFLASIDITEFDIAVK